VAGAALAAVLVLLAGVWWFAIRDDRPDDTDQGTTTGSGDGGAGGSSSGDARTFGVPTTADDCPAAEVVDAGALCTKRAQCWSAIVLIQGQLTSIRELPCEQAHVYETFAIAEVPPSVVDPYQDKLAENASVRQVCSTETMMASRAGGATRYAADKWSVEILPPTPEDREQSRDIYRCVATLTGFEGITGSSFRPR
jgi:hypothetical protein